MLTTRHKVAIARVAKALLVGCRRLVGLPPEIEATRGGIRWRLDLREGIDLAIFLRVYERATIALCERLVHPGNIVLDIGANIGVHTLHLARQVGPSGRVISFEPTEFAYRKQLSNCQLNPDLAPRIKSEQMMLTATDDSSVAPEIYSSWPLEKQRDVHHEHCGQLKATTGARAGALDSYIRQAAPARIDLIKLDVDGYEMDVLRGGAETLAKFRPRLIMELSPHLHAEHGHSVSELIEFLNGHGYRFFSESTGAPLPSQPEQLVGLIKPGASMNVFLEHGH